MPQFEEFGIIATTRIPTDAVTEWALIAENEGLNIFCVGDAFLVNQVYHYRGAISTISAVAMATKKIKLCLGVTSPFLRHPSVLAIEATTIDEISEGRLTLGLGTMTQALLNLGYNVHIAKSIAALKEAIHIIRNVSSGKIFSYKASLIDFEVNKVRLGFQPKRKAVPIYLGACRDKMLRLTGRLADGLIITSSSSACSAFMKHAISTVKESAINAGRDPNDVDIMSYPIVSISHNREEAKCSIKPLVATRLGRDHSEIFLEKSGVSPDRVALMKDLIASGKIDEAQRQVTDEDLEKFAIVGTPDDCIDKLRQFAGLGLRKLCFFVSESPDPQEAIRLLAREVIPNLK